VYTLFFVAWYIFFKIKMKKYIADANEKFVTISDYTVEVIDLPKNGTKIEDVKNFFEKKYGKIEEIYFTRIFKGILTTYQKQEKLNKKIRIEEIKSNIVATDKGISVE
jgi:hypothetical protein